MKNIIIISAVFLPEPVVSASLANDLASELAIKHNVVVLCPHPTRPEGFKFSQLPVFSNFLVERIDSFTSPSSNFFTRIWESYSFGIHCKKYLRSNQEHIDIIYMDAWPFFAQYLIVQEAKRLKIPCVTHIQDIYPESLSNKLPKPANKLINKLAIPIDTIILRNSTKIIGISQSMINYLSSSRKINKQKFELVRNWQNDIIFKEDYLKSNNNSQFVFMYVGSISPTADVEGLIYSYHLANIENSKLIIAGSGSALNNCLAISQKHKCNIEFCTVSPDYVPELQSKSNILILPLRKGISNTATPSKLTAYMLSGRPVIACVDETSDAAKIVQEAVCGFIVPPENYKKLAEAMQNVVKLDSNLLNELGINARRFAKKNLSKEENLKKLVAVITNINNN